MAKLKRQHFVPKVYINAWATGKPLEPYVLPLTAQTPIIARKQPAESICKANHLYTIPASFYRDLGREATELEQFIIESVVVNVWESTWRNVLSNLYDRSALIGHIKAIKGFVITQSLRTPSAMKEWIRHVHWQEDLLGETRTPPELYSALFGAFVTRTIGSELFQYIKCEIFRIDGSPNLITSDNPATFWQQDGEEYRMLPAGIPFFIGAQIPNYRIICPIHPKFLVVLSEGSVYNPIDFRYNVLPSDRVAFFNQLIEAKAHKVLIGKNVDDFYK